MNCCLFAVILCCPLLCKAQQGYTDYFTTYGKLSFSFHEKNRAGVHTEKNGRITGTIRDTILTGKWKQPEAGGDIRILFNRDFSKFTAWYNHADTKDSTATHWKSDWTGMKAPDTITRKYQTADGIIVFVIIGTQVEGNYPLYNGKILGELVDTNFTGVWLQANRGFGTLKITFSTDFTKFKGAYNDNNFRPEKWGKWDGVLVQSH